MDKIKMTTPLVEIDGDEMTRVLWQWVKDILICPYVDLKTEYYDLSIQNRDATDDKVTVEAAKACLKYGVGVKCATITPNAQRVEEFGLKRMYPSPNATIRAMMDGTVFRAPVLVRGITPLVPAWTKPIVIARHAYGDVYKAVEIKAHGGKATLCCDGEEKTVFDFCGEDGILQAQHNTDKSIRSFAKSCFSYALSQKLDLWFSTKDTISKVYDHRFKDIFQEIYDTEYKGLRNRVFLHAHRRRRGKSYALARRLYLGVEELRRRRYERYGGDGVRLACNDDFRVGFAERSIRVRSGARHCHKAFQKVSGRGRNFHKLGCNALCLDGRTQKERGTRRQRRTRGVCQSS